MIKFSKKEEKNHKKKLTKTDPEIVLNPKLKNEMSRTEKQALKNSEVQDETLNFAQKIIIQNAEPIWNVEDGYTEISVSNIIKILAIDEHYLVGMYSFYLQSNKVHE